MQSNNMQENVNSILARMDGNRGEDEKAPEQSIPLEGPEPIQDIYVLVVREHDEEELDQPQEDEVIETTLAPQKPPFIVLATCIFALLLPIASITFQLYLAFSPFTAIVTILPKSQIVTLSGTVQLGRIVSPLTLRASQTVATTGKGHQDAKAATGFITFYNGSFSEQTVPAGTILTGTDGVQVVTDQDAFLPAGNPPSYGQTTIAAHAIHPGSQGNIPSFAITQIYASTVLAKNTTAFYGGVDARDFKTVAKADIVNGATPLKSSLAQGLSVALRNQLRSGEVLISPTCTFQVSSDHQVGAEANQVTVTVAATCSAIAYNKDGLHKAVTQLLTSQAIRTLGAGYHLIGEFTVTVNQATRIDTTPTLVFSSHSTWVYEVTAKEQERIKTLIAGKTKHDALQLLSSLPGIHSIAITWRDDTRLPKDTQYIHLILPIQKS
jgi:hypothetical protein